ncbi:gamma-secretase-activating protein isoform X2 [Hemicordylus capensis]|uniref:gamma-secretase-activating protein isoform X2 n=1 Tax=Hemicordylus capensis TaxID=884348 RepID=UPI0023037E0F|nr:gamma-secretase-activating protein isoform X2 [Hemicordylus capensis]
MLLRVGAAFDPRRDVAPWLSEQTPAAELGDCNADTLSKNLETLHIVNVERNGNIVYTWKGNQRHTHIGLYDLSSRKNEHLYTFEKDLHVTSCSVNNEKTLLAASFLQSIKEERVPLFQPVSKSLTLLIEINPVNNVTVLKAVDSCVRVQFLYPVAETNTCSENCLLLISEDKYVEKVDIRVVKGGHKVVIESSNDLRREKIVDDLIWAQWDMLEQRLFYIVLKESRETLNCIQFYPDKNFKLILEAPLDISLADIELILVNLDYDQEMIPKPLNLQVFTNETGCLCICYSFALSPGELSYSVSFLHKGYSKMYTVALERTDSLEVKDLAFLNLDYYIAVYLPGHFLHLLNTRHPDLTCYNFFLTGEDAEINGLHSSSILSPLKSMVLDRSTGRMFTLEISKPAVLQFLWNSKLDSERLAALHCVLLHIGSTVDLETQVIQWISDNMSACLAFDPIQEFIVGSLYWRMCPEAINLDKLLPYTSLQCWNELVPGIICKTHIISLPVLKVQNCKGFWGKLSSSLECVKYAEPCLHFNSKVLRKEWDKLLSDERTEERMATYMKNIFENAKQVLHNLNTWNTEEKRVPFFQDDDYQQQLLTGLMVAQLKEHLVRHLQYVGKKKIDQIAVDYVSKLLDLICWIMESVWKKYSLSSWVLAFGQQGSSDETAVFRIMCQILQAAKGMCLPLPPGLGVRCLPSHTFLHYIDHGVLHLTDMCVLKLLKELDDTEKNTKLKLSVLTRLPKAIGHKVGQQWNHSASSNNTARNYVKLLLEKLRNKKHKLRVMDRLSAETEFLPLRYLVNMLAEAEHQGWMEQNNVNARFVEELALKHTTVLLGL